VTDTEQVGEPRMGYPSKSEIAEQNRSLVRRQREFREAADAVAVAFSRFPEVEAVALFGSVAGQLWKEVPRFRVYRRRGIEVWHECKDVDLAMWLSRLDNLEALNQARSRALRVLCEAASVGVAHHQVDVFILEPGSDRYLGRLCIFGQCPKGKPECLVPGCGRELFLRQHEGFAFRREALEGAVRLFDRRAGIVRRAAELPVTGLE
jgi:hypothetical protein